MSQPPKSVQDALLILVVAYLDPLVYVHIKVGRPRRRRRGRRRRGGRRRRRSSSSSNKKILPHVNIFLRWILRPQKADICTSGT